MKGSTVLAFLAGVVVGGAVWAAARGDLGPKAKALFDPECDKEVDHTQEVDTQNEDLLTETANSNGE